MQGVASWSAAGLRTKRLAVWRAWEQTRPRTPSLASRRVVTSPCARLPLRVAVRALFGELRGGTWERGVARETVRQLTSIFLASQRHRSTPSTTDGDLMELDSSLVDTTCVSIP